MRGLLVLMLLLGCSADHHAAKGKAALDEHDLAEAEKHFRAGLGREPNHVGALSGLGWVYLLAAQHEAASAAFGHCLSVSPKEVDCLRGSAGVATAQGNPAQAKTQLNKAVAQAPHDARVQSSLALLELASGEVDEAITRYRGLIAREPDRAEYRLGLAEAHLRARDFTAALSLSLLKLGNSPPLNGGDHRLCSCKASATFLQSSESAYGIMTDIAL